MLHLFIAWFSADYQSIPGVQRFHIINLLLSPMTSHLEEVTVVFNKKRSLPEASRSILCDQATRSLFASDEERALRARSIHVLHSKPHLPFILIKSQITDCCLSRHLPFVFSQQFLPKGFVIPPGFDRQRHRYAPAPQQHFLLGLQA